MAISSEHRLSSPKPADATRHGAERRDETTRRRGGKRISRRRSNRCKRTFSRISWFVGRFCCRGGGYRGGGTSKSLYQPGNYTSFRAISSRSEGLRAACVLAVPRRVGRARLPSCSYPFIAPRVGINCYSCLRRVINCRNLSCAGVIAAGLPRNFLQNEKSRSGRNVLSCSREPTGTSSIFYVSPCVD